MTIFAFFALFVFEVAQTPIYMGYIYGRTTFPLSSRDYDLILASDIGNCQGVFRKNFGDILVNNCGIK